MWDFLRIALVGLAGGTFLNWFYVAAQSKWPLSYYAISSLVDEGISQSWLRYTLFRLLPPYAIGVLVSSFAVRFGFSITWTIAVCGMMHIGATHVTALYRGVKAKEMSVRIATAHIVMIIMSTAAFIAARFSAKMLYPYMPGPDKYVEVALTGVVAATLVFQMQRATQRRFEPLLAATDFRARVGRDLIDHLDKECLRYRVDPDLMLAILVAEDRQRPAWFRRVERLAGRIGFKGTFGIAQSSHNWRASDQQSITEAVKNLEGALVQKGGEAWRRDAHLRYQLERHNRGAVFIGYASEVYSAIVNGYKARSVERESHGAISLRVLTCERVGSRWRISGDIADRFTQMAADCIGDDVAPNFVMTQARAGLRAEWSTEVSIDVNHVQIIGRQVSDAGATVDLVKADLYLH